MKRHVILGPPGTGKTTALLNIVEEKLAEGIAPEEIAFVSFTKKAATEARDRAVEKFTHLYKKSFIHFRTLHSTAYRQLQVSQGDLLGTEDLKKIGRLSGLAFSGFINQQEGMAGAASADPGDLALFLIGVARAKMVDPHKFYDTLSNDVRRELKSTQYNHFLKTLEGFKAETGQIDFNDLLDQAIKVGPLKGIRVAIVDEAQDLTKVQWAYVESLFANAEDLYIAGDDDQAIYRWSGADIDTFLSLEGERTVLERSWRLPEAIWEYTNKFTNRIKHRYEKDWHSNGEEGLLKFHTKARYVPIRAGGEWLVLVRNTYQMRELKDLFTTWGLPYAVRGQSQVRPVHMRAINNWETLKQGEAITKAQAQNVYDHLNVEQVKGDKDLQFAMQDDFTMADLQSKFGLLVDPLSDWWDALKKVGDEGAYYRSIRRNGEKLGGIPRINLSTIHGVKGGEADNVMLLNSMSARTQRGYEANPDDEHRVFYVGATRAKKALHIVQSGGKNAYPFPTNNSRLTW